jgi:Helix-turn-helix domain
MEKKMTKEITITQEEMEAMIRKVIKSELASNTREEDPLLTRNEAAEYLRIQVSTLAAWAVRGDGPAVTKLGSRALYRQSGLDGFAKENTLSR